MLNTEIELKAMARPANIGSIRPKAGQGDANSPRITRVIIMAADSKYDGTLPCWSNKAGGKQLEKSRPKRLYPQAVPAPNAISVLRHITASPSLVLNI